MGLSLNSFKANVKDAARPNRFLVTLDPSALSGGVSNKNLPTWQSKFEFLCKTAALPGRAIGEVFINWQGMKYNIGGDPTFEDVTFTFINNYEWDLRAFFEQWMDAIANIDTNERESPEFYKTDGVKMDQLGRKEGEIISTYNLFGAYPTNIAAIDLSMENGDQLEEISVTLKYDTWVRTYTKK